MKPAFNIQIGNEKIEVLDSNLKPFEHLLTIDDFGSDTTACLMELLQRLKNFISLSEMKNTISPNSKPPYNLDIIETEPPEDGINISSSWDFKFHNYNPRNSNIIFLTIFDLNPLYGICKIIPHDETHGHPLEPGESWNVIVDIHVPEALVEEYQTNPSFVSAPGPVYLSTYLYLYIPNLSPCAVPYQNGNV